MSYDAADNARKCYDVAITAMRDNLQRSETQTYEEFIASKQPSAPPIGCDVIKAFPSAMKPFQADITRWALRRGRAAIFAGTGLGKTLMQLAWADAVANKTGGRVLILTPLAVAQQTVAEARKFGIDSVAYAADASEAKTRIVITNYDRFEKFDASDYVGVVLDESSIIKSHDSKTRAMLIAACAQVVYRLCCTATPAPNDWVELGNHAEFLGVMTEKEMLSMYFVHDGSIRAGESATGDGWRLKRHAEDAFWRWVSTWGAMVRSPRDLGYDDPGYDLPPIRRHQVTVPVEYKPSGDTLFPIEARTMSERLGARRSSIDDRVAKAVEIVNTKPDASWLIWCNLNAESAAVTAAMPDALEVKGSDDRDIKASRLLGFCERNPRILVSKASIAGFGLNYQHCSNMVFLGLNDSFEQLYQAIRRCWRFGQTQEVHVYLVASELEGAVVANLEKKEAQYEAMGEAMARHMKSLVLDEVRGDAKSKKRKAKHVKMEVPQWLIK
jgi:hypothetical protein